MKILVVDDDAVSRVLLRRILERNLSAEVVEAANGKQAWATLTAPVAAAAEEFRISRKKDRDAADQPESAAIDLVILDVMMPEVNGIELLTKIRSDLRLHSLKVIICTALSNRATITQVANLGLGGYILKPFSAATVLEQINKAFHQPSGFDLHTQIIAMSQKMGIEPTDYVQSLQLLTREIKQNLISIPTLLASRDTMNAAAVAETIRGSCANMGLKSLAALAHNLLQALHEMSAESPAKKQTVSEFNPFEAAWRKVLAVIDLMAEENSKLAASLETLTAATV
jgi:CheY-like chemotaxis protein